MLVRMLIDKEYEPAADDSPRCYGQLRKRASTITVGGKEKCGPMVHYFRKGSAPDLKEAVAQAFIAEGAAEPFDGEPVLFKSTKEILDGMPVVP